MKIRSCGVHKSAREGIKVMIAVSLRITPLNFSVYQTLPDHLFGFFLIVGPLLLLIFAVHADGLMIEN
jgi:hypothetical protein